MLSKIIRIKMKTPSEIDRVLPNGISDFLTKLAGKEYDAKVDHNGKVNVLINDTWQPTVESYMYETRPELTRHYGGIIELENHEIESNQAEVDVYRFYGSHRIHEQDRFGILFHILKTVVRFGKKKSNSKDREVRAIVAQALCLAKHEKVDVQDLINKEMR